eukprot:g2363.t1
MIGGARFDSTPLTAPGAAGGAGADDDEVTYERISATRDGCINLTRRLCSLAPAWHERGSANLGGPSATERAKQEEAAESGSLPERGPHHVTGAGHAWNDAVERLYDTRKVYRKNRVELEMLMDTYDSSNREAILRDLNEALSGRQARAADEITILAQQEGELFSLSKQMDEDHEFVKTEVWDQEMKVCNTLQHFHSQIRSRVRNMIKKAAPVGFSEKKSKKRWTAFHKDESNIFALELNISRLQSKLNERSSMLDKALGGALNDLEGAEQDLKSAFQAESDELNSIVGRQQMTMSAHNAKIKTQRRAVEALEEELRVLAALKAEAEKQREGGQGDDALGGAGSGDADPRTLEEIVEELKNDIARTEDELQHASDQKGSIAEQIREVHGRLADAEHHLNEARHGSHTLKEDKAGLEKQLQTLYGLKRETQKLHRSIKKEEEAIAKLVDACSSAGVDVSSQDALDSSDLAAILGGMPKETAEQAAARIAAEKIAEARDRVKRAKQSDLRKRAEAHFKLRQAEIKLEEAERDKTLVEMDLQRHEDEEARLQEELQRVKTAVAMGEIGAQIVSDEDDDSDALDASSDSNASSFDFEELDEEDEEDEEDQEDGRGGSISAKTGGASARNVVDNDQQRRDSSARDADGSPSKSREGAAVVFNADDSEAATAVVVHDAAASALEQVAAAARLAEEASTEEQRREAASKVEEAVQDVYTWKAELADSLKVEKEAIAAELKVTDNAEDFTEELQTKVADKVQRRKNVHAEVVQKVAKADEAFRQTSDAYAERERAHEAAAGAHRLYMAQHEQGMKSLKSLRDQASRADATPMEKAQLVEQCEAVEQELRWFESKVAATASEEQRVQGKLRDVSNVLETLKDDIASGVANETEAQREVAKAEFQAKNMGVKRTVAQVAKGIVNARVAIISIKDAFVNRSTNASSLKAEKGLLGAAQAVEGDLAGTLAEHDEALKELRDAFKAQKEVVEQMVDALAEQDQAHFHRVQMQSGNKDTDNAFLDILKEKTDVVIDRANAELFEKLADAKITPDDRECLVQAMVESERAAKHQAQVSVVSDSQRADVREAAAKEIALWTLLQARHDQLSNLADPEGPCVAKLHEAGGNELLQAYDGILSSVQPMLDSVAAKMVARGEEDLRIRRQTSSYTSELSGNDDAKQIVASAITKMEEAAAGKRNLLLNAFELLRYYGEISGAYAKGKMERLAAVTETYLQHCFDAATDLSMTCAAYKGSLPVYDNDAERRKMKMSLTAQKEHSVIETEAKNSGDAIQEMREEGTESELLLQLDEATTAFKLAQQRQLAAEASHRIKNIVSKIEGMHGLDKIPRFTQYLAQCEALEKGLAAAEEKWDQATADNDPEDIAQAEAALGVIGTDVEDLEEVTLAAIEDVQRA